jgi:hypothetical protein
LPFALPAPVFPCYGPSWPPGFELFAGNSYSTACRQRNKHGPQWGQAVVGLEQLAVAVMAQTERGLTGRAPTAAGGSQSYFGSIHLPFSIFTITRAR